jgi:5-methylcytosine-specific restriction endonuclease McrA
MWSMTTQVRNARRRARKQGLSANLTLQEWQNTIEDFDFCCAYCGCDAYPSTIEHYISLAAGGGTCIDNCIPSCSSCNSLKGSLLPEQVFHVSPERMEQIRRYLRSRKKGKRNPEYLRTPIMNMRKRESQPMGIIEDLRQSEQRLAHGEKITLRSMSQQIVLKVSNTSENLLHAPCYEIGLALTADECIVLARDLLSAATSPHIPVEEKLPETSYSDWSIPSM